MNGSECRIGIDEYLFLFLIPSGMEWLQSELYNKNCNYLKACQVFRDKSEQKKIQIWERVIPARLVLIIL